MVSGTAAEQDWAHAGGPAVERTVETVLPTRYGPFRMIGYRADTDVEHLALVRGAVERDTPAHLVRLHSECLTGDALGSLRCDCGEQLDAALRMVARIGSGAVVYLRGHEGRGIGLLEKLRAYALQDQGLDTVDANTVLGHPADARDYGAAAEILKDLGLTRIRLLSSNPAKQMALEEHGIEVTTRQSLIIPERAENARYLATKRRRMNHDRPVAGGAWQQLLDGAVPVGVESPPEQELVHRYAPLLQYGEQMVLAQLGQSMDGFIASRTGDAEFVTGEEDREHLHRLRAIVDAVVVGASTVAQDDCRLTVRAVSGPNPVRVVLDPHGRVPSGAYVLTEGDAPTLWLVGPRASVGEVASHVEVVPLRGGVDDDGMDPDSVLGMLRERGLGRVLVEGGGRTVSRFVHGGRVDRLYLTVAPLLIGDGVPGIRFDGTDALSGALTAPARRFLLGRDVCTEFTFRDATAS